MHLLVPGGLIALATLALIIFIGYQTWFEESLAQETGLILILILSPFYVGGVFLFSYGYELYNIPRAIRLTAIIVFVTLASVVIIAVLFLLLGNSKGGSGSSSKSKTSRKSSSLSSGSAKPSMQNRSGLGFPIFIGGGRTRVETREVTRDIIKEVQKNLCQLPVHFARGLVGGI